ncbi:anthocyanidin 3-O-glucosyltransferase 5-like [Corylus avellana]|uniref:anthocyanidin 3-O-glucosyltransferase 5-like n=1 Tax=Corylus avellana TaxID=13451 RepID=UPI001E1EB79C|nr:anthocyanidin 3-O-glucosyltransferase 5-like [Corylus avellana]
METSKSKPHAVIVSSPGVGHLVCDLEFGNRLVTDHSFQVTFFVVLEYQATPGESQLIQSANANTLLDIVVLPPVNLSGQVEPSTPIFTRLASVMREIRPTLRSEISTLKPTPSALFVDVLGTPALEVAEEFHMLKYVFVTSAWPLALMLYAPILDKEVEGEYVDQKQPIRLPGCMSVRPEDLVDPMMNRTKPEYNSFLQVGSEMRKSDGVLVNTWEDLDATTLTAMREEESYGSAPVYAVGPLIRAAGPPASRSQLLDWLDEQPVESVLYISFGSLGVLSAQQITELAWGLELSRQRFMWVLRPPSKKDASADTGDNALDYLPDGFLERTHSLGLVFTQWAPQSEILGHRSTGGFLSHCGWNSSLESILSGVPMIAWPLYAEQKMNATELAEEVGVALRPKIAPTKGVVGREEIEIMVRKVMEEPEGKAMRARVKELKISGEKALTSGGTSFNVVSQLAKQMHESEAFAMSH